MIWPDTAWFSDIIGYDSVSWYGKMRDRAMAFSGMRATSGRIVILDADSSDATDDSDSEPEVWVDLRSSDPGSPIAILSEPASPAEHGEVSEVPESEDASLDRGEASDDSSTCCSVRSRESWVTFNDARLRFLCAAARVGWLIPPRSTFPPWTAEARGTADTVGFTSGESGVRCGRVCEPSADSELGLLGISCRLFPPRTAEAEAIDAADTSPVTSNHSGDSSTSHDGDVRRAVEPSAGSTGI